MIHTAEDILEIIFEPTGMPFQTTREDLQMAITLNPSLELIEKAINEARIEAIKECAEIVTLCGRLYTDEDDFEGHSEIRMTNKRGMVDTIIKPDKQSILKLLDQIK